MKFLVLSCDGIGCSARVEAPCEAHSYDVHLPGWLERTVHDELTSRSHLQGAQSATRVLHYCPTCVPRLDPSLHPGLVSFHRVSEASPPLSAG